MKSGKKLSKLLLIAMILMLCGCSLGKGDVQTKSAGESFEKTPITKVDVTKLEWKSFEEVKKDGQKYHVISYQENMLAERKNRERIRTEFYPVFSKDDIYFLGRFIDKDADSKENTHLLMTTYHTVTGESSETELVFSKMENASGMTKEQLEQLDESILSGHVFLRGFDVRDGKWIVFLSVYDEELKPLRYDRMVLDGATKLESVADLSKYMIQNKGDEIYTLESYPVIAMPEGGTCLAASEETGHVLITLDQTGEVISRQELDDKGSGRVEYAGKTMDGTPVYSLTMTNKAFFCTPDQILCDVRFGKDFSAQKAFLNDFGELLLWGYQELVAWDVEKGSAESLCSLAGFTADECIGIWRNSEEKLLLAFDDGEDCSLYVYDAGEEEEQTKLTLLQRFSDKYTTDCSESYSRTHPGITVEVSQMENPWRNETLLNRLAEEMKEGKGPDVLLLDADQFFTLQGAGVLAPLDDVLLKETKDHIYRSVLQMGTIDGKLYGLPSEAWLSTLLISKKNWDGKSWTLGEAMELYDQKKKEDGCLERFKGMSYPASADQLLYDLCLQTLGDSPFLDLERKQCHFDCEEFYQCLAFCKDNAEDPNGNDSYNHEDLVDQMREGKALVYSMIGHVGDYCAARIDLGEDYVPLGYPSENGKGMLAESHKYVVVNAFSERREEIRDYLEYLFSEKNQRKYLGSLNCVRKDAITDHLTEGFVSWDGTRNCIIKISSNGAYYVKSKPDGTSFVMEYVELLDHATPVFSHPKIRDIILEEAGAYFSGDKSEKEVAKIIQSRIQLYLSE